MTKTENHPAAIVRVHRPELTPEERARRMKSIKEAAERLLLAVALNERNEKHEHHHRHH